MIFTSDKSTNDPEKVWSVQGQEQPTTITPDSTSQVEDSDDICDVFQPDFTKYTDRQNFGAVATELLHSSARVEQSSSGDVQSLQHLAEITKKFTPRAPEGKLQGLDKLSKLIDERIDKTQMPSTAPSVMPVGSRANRSMTKVKLENLWKNLLREFRRYLKEQAEVRLPVQQEVRVLTFQEQSNLLCEAFNLPSELRACPHPIIAMAWLVYAHVPHMQAHLQQNNNGSAMRRQFCGIFRSSTKRGRERFFGDTLIRHLWTEFRIRRPDLIWKHACVNASSLSQIDHYRRLKFLEDLRAMEKKANFSILP